MLDRLIDSWNKLRRRNIWTDSCEGGAAFIETTIDNQNRWHAHLHVVATGNYIPQNVLSKEWHEITGDSFIVHITLARTSESACTYAAKYAGKGISLNGLTDDEVMEALIAMRGRKLCSTFGSWRKFRLNDNEQDDGKWIALCPLHEMWARARAGDTESMIAVLQLETHRPTRTRAPPPPPA